MSKSHPERNPPTLIDLLNQFSRSREYQFGHDNRPTSETGQRIDKLSVIQQLVYSLYAKGFLFGQLNIQNHTLSDNVNSRMATFEVGPFHIVLNAFKELNSSDLSSYLPHFHNVQKVVLNQREFIKKYGKNPSYNELAQLNIEFVNLPTSAYRYAEDVYFEKQSLLGHVQHHIFAPIIKFIKAYNEFKRPSLATDVIAEFLHFTTQMQGHTVYHDGFDNVDLNQIEANFVGTLETSLSCFSMSGVVDYSTGYYTKDPKGNACFINFSHILEAEVPTTNVLRYIKSKLQQDEHSGADQSTGISSSSIGKSKIAGEENFINCYNKLIHQLIKSNFTKGIITDYESWLFIEIRIDDKGELELILSIHDISKLFYLRYMIFSFLSIKDYESEKKEREKVCQYILNKAAVAGNHPVSETPYQKGLSLNKSNRGDGFAVTNITTSTTGFSSGLSGEISDESMTPQTQSSSSEDNFGEDDKIFSEWSDDPGEIALRFKVANLVLFNHNPKIIKTSLNEIISVDSTILRDLGYADNFIREEKLVIKLAPIESLFVDRYQETYNSEDGRNIINTDQESVNTIFQELTIHLRILKRYQDSFVVRVLDFGYLADHTSYRDSGKVVNWKYNGAYILMDQIAAQPLSIHELKLLSLEVKENIIASYNKLHDIGIIHNDIKPDNLLVVNSGDKQEVKLIDFGNSFISDDEDQKTNEILRVKHMLGV